MSPQRTIGGRYEIEEIIGKGGMGIVYRAFDPVMQREVAIKTLHDPSSQPILALFYRECDVLRSIVHPNVIDILDMGDFDEDGTVKPYYVMPLLRGKTLYDLLHPANGVSEPLSVDRAVEVIVQTSRGLHAAHERELLHRDVKPKNIFIIDNYSVKLIDFGVAHLLDNTSRSGVKGTLEYMAPEQVTMKGLTRRSDIFSLATVCYETLTGRQPFQRNTGEKTAAAVLDWHPPLACEANPSVPKAISQVVSKALAKEPWQRFETAAQFAEALQRAWLSGGRHEPFHAGGASFAERDYEALTWQTTSRWYDYAEKCFAAEEYALVLRKVQEILELNPHHDKALKLRKKVDDILERNVEDLLQAAQERLEHDAFADAQRALDDARRLRPNDPRVRELLSRIDSRQKSYHEQRHQQIPETERPTALIEPAGLPSAQGEQPAHRLPPDSLRRGPEPPHRTQAEKSQPVHRTVPSPGPSIPATPSVLVIDDDDSLRDTIAIMLEQEGYKTELAPNGRAGLEQALTSKPDLVLVDLRMPGLSGVEVCKRLRASDRQTPIIVLSAVRDEVDRILLLEIGADDFLVKPFNHRELLARIRAVLRRARPNARPGA